MSAAARRPSSLCLFCQSRRFNASHRRLSSASKRHLETVSIHAEDDSFILDSPKPPQPPTDSSILSNQSLPTTDGLRETALGFDALWKRKDIRLNTLRGLSNPYPDPPSGRQRHTAKGPDRVLANPQAVIPHAVFREHVKATRGAKPIRTILRAQLLRCERPREIFKIVAVAMQSREMAMSLAMLIEPLMRALYRCRQNVTDPEVLRTLNTIVTRFQHEGLKVEMQLLHMALKFAARARSLPYMKKYLKLVRDSGKGMNSNVYRSIIAKCSIGHRGLGEIRNGRWRRKELKEVLLGFEDAEHLPPEQQYHLEAFLIREDWQFLHGWVAVLARCKQSDRVWEEWQLWKESEAWKKPKELMMTDLKAQKYTSPGGGRMTNKMRGAYWFLEQMTYSGDLEKAWKILDESSISFATVKIRVKDKLLEAVQYATIFDEEVRGAIVEKYDRDLGKIEAALGVVWEPGKGDGEGQHVLFMDQEEAMEKLTEEGFRLDEDFGYPWETSPLVPEGEKDLHDAEEGTRMAGQRMSL